MSRPADAPKDPLVEAQIERALAPYRGWPPAMLATLREGLEEMYATHPTALALLEQLRDRAAPQRSGEVPIDGAEVEPERKAGGKEGA
jgi:hypothetical protein